MPEQRRERVFQDRLEAGKALGAALGAWKGQRPLVLALPRGGVVVGYGVARALGAPLDVYLARKLGAPMHPELGMGAIAEGGTQVLDDSIVRLVGATREQIRRVCEREELELRRRVALYRGGRALPDLSGRTVVLVDDGVATGGTARAALRDLRRHQPARVIFAAPVGAAEAVAGLRAEADEVVCLETPGWFHAIGEWYADFRQIGDEEVLDWLARASQAHAGEAPQAPPAAPPAQAAAPPAQVPAPPSQAAAPPAEPAAPPAEPAVPRARPSAPAAAAPVAAAAPAATAASRAATAAAASRTPAGSPTGVGSRAAPGPHVQIRIGPVVLPADVEFPRDARGLVVFAHGSGSTRRSPRNRSVAEALRRAGYGTLLFDLLTEGEAGADAIDGRFRFDIGLLSRRLVGVMDEVVRDPCLGPYPLILFGASTGAAAALVAAGERPDRVRAVISRGGRPDLAGQALQRVRAPTLLIVGGRDTAVLELNREALRALPAGSMLSIVAGATHLFEETGALEQVARLATEFLGRVLVPAPA